jgi:hypothetical protein
MQSTKGGLALPFCAPRKRRHSFSTANENRNEEIYERESQWAPKA